MRRSIPLLSTFGSIALAAIVASCAATPETQEHVASSSAAITRSTILANAQQWVTAKLLYCQAANHAPDYDTSCAATCEREDNPLWDPYRSDCSGFVSWSWGLPAPGRDTSEFAPADTTVSFTIDGSDLQPGDALNVPGDHIILFTGWVTVGSVANFYEEPGCSASTPYAHAFTSNVTISGSSVDVAYEGKTFTAIRYTGITTTDDGGVTATDSGSTSSSTDCYSDTLGSTVPENTCVQSASDGNWYQCDAGSWVVRSTDPAACIAQYPLGSSLDAGVESGSAVDAAVPIATDAGLDDASTTTTCALAGGTCVAATVGSCATGHVGSESCGASPGFECCLPGATPPPGATTSDGGTFPADASGDASTAIPTGPKGSTGPTTSAGGCAVQSAPRGEGTDALLLGAGTIVVASLSRRRRSR